jgi:Permeases of the drug/metabolite transporter (DMT) superfamily
MARTACTARQYPIHRVRVLLGILSSLVTAFTANYALSRLEATKAVVFSNLSTVVSIAAGALVLGEPVEIYHLAGSLLIIAGVWGTNRPGTVRER